MSWVISILVLIVIGFMLDREIYFYEGAHLGPRLQSWLYDRWSKKYDVGKRESQLLDDDMLAQPMLEKLQEVPEPFVLDFATSTGRLSYSLISRPEFNGRIIALDISQGMLEQAAAKLGRAERRDSSPQSRRRSTDLVEFLRHQSMPLPFPDATFDVVCCLKVLELLPDAQAALNEMARLLRPGGILLTSRGTEESERKAKVKSGAQMTYMLKIGGFENIQITKWWKLFDRVFAVKRGSSPPVGTKKLIDVLQCPSCTLTRFSVRQDLLTCLNCGRVVPISDKGIVLN